MNTNKPDISKFIETSSEHEWIDLTEFPEYPIDDNTTPVDLNLRCKAIIKEWLQEYMGLPSKEEFPYSGSPECDRLVSQIVNGFCLKIEDFKVIFIPSEQIDLDSFEVAQEWVDLTNWMGDYYVPIQVDVDAQQLQLWGMITHQELKQVQEPDDRQLRYYNVDADRTIDNLEVLWTSCELAPDPRSENIPELVTQGVKGFIDRVKLEAGTNFDRLILAFEQWGAILNDRDYLYQYLNLSEGLIQEPVYQKIFKSLEDVFHGLYPLWETMDHFINPPSPQMAFRGVRNSVSKLRGQKDYHGISLVTPEQINTAILQLYTQERTISKPTITGVENLVTLIEKSSDNNIRWTALEYLWMIDPTHPKLSTTCSIADIGVQFATNSLALMISRLSIVNNERSILLRIYPISTDIYLPAEVKLSVLDENGQVILLEDKPLEAMSRIEPKDNYIQVRFIAEPLDRFGVCVSLGEQQFTDWFAV